MAHLLAPEAAASASSSSGSFAAGRANIIVRDDDAFDWESYIAAYTGRTRISRLLFLALHSPSLRLPCANAALALLRQTPDAHLYSSAALVRNTLPDGVALRPAAERVPPEDRAWMAEAEQEQRRTTEKLEMELRGYQNNMIKESIRIGHRDLGNWLRDCGQLSDALKCYTRTREFCSTSEHVVEMCLGVIEVSLELHNFSNVSTFVSKAEGVLESYNPSAAAASASKHSGSFSSATGVPSARGGPTPGGDVIGALFRAGGSVGNEASESVASSNAESLRKKAAQSKGLRDLTAKLAAAGAVAQLGMGNYERAARAFLAIDPSAAGAGAEQIAHILSPADIALYGVFCALATFPRSTLKSEVVERASFRPFLEHAPHVRQLLEAFAACDYKRALDLLDVWKSRHQLDVYLAPHLGHLTDALQQRALQQFCAPFESVAVERMAAAFGWDSEHTLEKLVALIQAGKLEARIDWSRMVLETKRVDERTALFENAIEVGQKRVRAAKALLLRMELVENGLIVKAPLASEAS